MHDNNPFFDLLETLSFESERLVTDSLKLTDVLALFQIYSDTEAMKFRGSGPIKSIDEAELMVQESLKLTLDQAQRRIGIRTKEDHTLIGTLLLTFKAQLPTTCEIGFSFGKSYWGQGYAKETLGMVEAKLASLLPDLALEAWVVKENLGSVHIFEKAGYSKAQQTRFPGSFHFVKTKAHSMNESQKRSN